MKPMQLSKKSANRESAAARKLNGGWKRKKAKAESLPKTK